MNTADVRRLQQKKGRDELGHFLVEGEHLVLELVKAARRDPALLTSRLFVTPEHAHTQSPFDMQVVSARQMAKMADTQTPQGILAAVPILPATAPRTDERAVYLHEVQDPGNLGSILRSLAWFGGFRCLLSPDSVDPHHPKVVRASMGAIFHVSVETGVTLSALAARYPRLACLDLHGERLSSASFSACRCFMFGNEARGLPRDSLAGLDVHAFSVPGCGTIESLNLAAVVGMTLYELNR